MIEIKNVSYKYKDGKNVLNNINIDIQDGEIIGIIRKKWFGKVNFSKTNFWNNYTKRRYNFNR